MSNDDHPPPHRPPGPSRLLRLGVALLVLLGVAWGISEHDAVISSAIGVAPPADDAPRDTTGVDVQRSGEDAAATEAPVAAPVAAGSDRAVTIAPLDTRLCRSGCTGPPTPRGPPGT